MPQEKMCLWVRVPQGSSFVGALENFLREARSEYGITEVRVRQGSTVVVGQGRRQELACDVYEISISGGDTDARNLAVKILEKRLVPGGREWMIHYFPAEGSDLSLHFGRRASRH